MQVGGTRAFGIVWRLSTRPGWGTGQGTPRRRLWNLGDVGALSKPGN